MTTPYLSPDAPTPDAGRGARPTGVTILAVLNYIGAGFLVLAAIAFMALGAAFGSMFGAEGGVFGAAIGGFIGFFMLIFAALAAVTGYGFWSGAGWGWVLGLVMWGLSALSALSSLAQREFSALISLALAGFVIWYLLQPGVKRWFGKA